MNLLMSEVSVVPSSLWIGFCIGIILLLSLDLSLFGKSTHQMSRKSALLESSLWITIALLFNGWFAVTYGKELGTEFLTGYLIEKSLSIDNLFVMLLVFSAFKIPSQYQHRILFYGVLGAIVLRAIFILIGAQLLHHFHWILYVFGAILVITAIKFLRETDDKADVSESWSTRFLKRIIPTTTTIKGNHFFIV